MYFPLLWAEDSRADCVLSVSLSLVKGDNCAWTPVCSQHQDAGLSPATLETGQDLMGFLFLF